MGCFNMLSSKEKKNIEKNWKKVSFDELCKHFNMNTLSEDYSYYHNNNSQNLWANKIIAFKDDVVYDYQNDDDIWKRRVSQKDLKLISQRIDSLVHVSKTCLDEAKQLAGEYSVEFMLNLDDNLGSICYDGIRKRFLGEWSDSWC